MDKRIRATLRPMSKTYKDICDTEEQIRAQKNKNQQYRQQLLDVDREIDAMVLKIDTYRALKLSESSEFNRVNTFYYNCYHVEISSSVLIISSIHTDDSIGSRFIYV